MQIIKSTKARGINVFYILETVYTHDKRLFNTKTK